jgi:hypothetical protein
MTHELRTILKTVSNKLPERKVIRYDDTYWQGEDLLLTGIKSVKGKPIVKGETYKLGLPVYHVYNHEHKITIAFLAHGMQGVYNYLEPWIGEAKLKEVKRNFMRIN